LSDWRGVRFWPKADIVSIPTICEQAYRISDEKSGSQSRQRRLGRLTLHAYRRIISHGLCSPDFGRFNRRFRCYSVSNERSRRFYKLRRNDDGGSDGYAMLPDTR
jgi:hypothetical protein